MYKKLLVLLSIIVSMNTFADDNEDIKYIYKLYQNKDYKISAEESEKFLFKYPGSKHYDVAQNLLGQSFYQIKEYEKAQKIFNKLLNSAYSSDANYYLALINIETGNLNIAYSYSKGLKDINREKILYTLAVKEYSNNNLNKAREYFEELPDDVKSMFSNVMDMQTSEEYDEEMRRQSDADRSRMQDMVTPNGTGRNINFEVDEDSGEMSEVQDLSWLDDLNK